MSEILYKYLPGDLIIPEPPLILAISGLIGAGKTTLSNQLGEKFGLKIYHELGPNTKHLELFYSDMKKYSFTLQIHLLTTRLLQYMKIVSKQQPAIIDRTLEEDAVFANTLFKTGNMTQFEYDTYIRLAGIIHNNMRRPTAIIHLDVTPEIALQRIKNRGRAWEQGITIEYLVSLKEAYDNFINQLSIIVPVIKIDWNEFPDIIKISEQIMTKIKTLNNNEKKTD